MGRIFMMLSRWMPPTSGCDRWWQWDARIFFKWTYQLWKERIFWLHKATSSNHKDTSHSRNVQRVYALNSSTIPQRKSMWALTCETLFKTIAKFSDRIIIQWTKTCCKESPCKAFTRIGAPLLDAGQCFLSGINSNPALDFIISSSYK